MKTVHKIDENGRKNGCPLGHCCDKCNLYQPTYKEISGGEIVQEIDCTWNNIALLVSETKGRVLGVQQAVESARNETIKRQDAHLRLVGLEDNALLPG